MFPFQTWEQCTLLSENVTVTSYPVEVVARAFEYNVATIFVVSTSCGSDLHGVTWFMAYLCCVFCSVSSQS